MAYPVVAKQRRFEREKIGEELNLVPFIDMLVVLLTFLLITVTILQTAIIELSLPTSASGAGSTLENPMEGQPLTLSIAITDKGLQVIGGGGKLPPIPKKGGKYNFEKLSEQLKMVKEEYPGQTAVIIVSESNIIYDYIIKTMDVCLEAGMPDISLSGRIA